MEPVTGVFVALIIGATATIGHFIHSTLLRARWQEITKRLQLQLVSAQTPLLGEKVLSGILPGGTSVALHERESRGGRHTEVRVGAGSAIPAWLGLRSETLGTAISKAMGDRDLTVGDRDFDDEVLVHGEPLTVAAVLTAEARATIRKLLSAGFEVEGGAVIKRLRGRTNTDEVEVTVRDAVTLVELLAYPSSPSARVAAIGRRDPVPGVRLRCLALLAEHCPDAPETTEAMATALEDRAPEVRLWAARRQGEAGVPVMVGLLNDPSASNGVVVEALRALDVRVPIESASALLTGSRGAAVLAEAARALGRSGAGAAEPHLVAALGSAEHHVREAAVDALAETGSIAAVAALRDVAAAHPLDLGFRRAVSAAIAAIQARAAGAAPGQLALADTDRGALSLVDTATSGQLAIHDDERR